VSSVLGSEASYSRYFLMGKIVAGVAVVVVATGAAVKYIGKDLILKKIRGQSN
jgi:hypothetical protein